MGFPMRLKICNKETSRQTIVNFKLEFSIITPLIKEILKKNKIVLNF